MAKKTTKKAQADAPKELPKKSRFNGAWILEKSIPIVKKYKGKITLRGLHYQLVGLGMTNDVTHYKNVVATMTKARWEGVLEYGAFMDHERDTIGWTNFRETDVDSAIDNAIDQIKEWANDYTKNRWENQPIYPEVFIEKKALQGYFEDVCRNWGVALNPCKGYPSITYLNLAKDRFRSAQRNGKKCVILYFGDYDCSGEDIPRSIDASLQKMGLVGVEVRRIALMEKQVKAWKLPFAPTKKTDSRGNNWGGLGQVELDAVSPEKITELLRGAIESVFDTDLHNELMEQEEQEGEEFRNRMKERFNLED